MISPKQANKTIVPAFSVGIPNSKAMFEISENTVDITQPESKLHTKRDATAPGRETART